MTEGDGPFQSGGTATIAMGKYHAVFSTPKST